MYENGHLPYMPAASLAPEITTVLLVLGVSERAVMGLMGWSSTAMAARYQHMVDTVRTNIARQVGGLIWKPDGAWHGRRR